MKKRRKLSKLQKLYREFFLDMLTQYDVTSPVQLLDKRSEFFNRIKKEWPKVKKTFKESIERKVLVKLIKEEIRNYYK